MTLHLLDANVLIRAHEDYYPLIAQSNNEDYFCRFLA